MNNFKEKIGETLNSERFSSTTMTALVIAVVLVANTLLYSVFSLLGWQISPASQEDFSLSGNLDETMELARGAGKKITILFCYPEKTVREHSTGGYVYRTAKEFESKYPETVELKFVNIITNVDDEGNHLDVSKYSKDADGNEVLIAKTSVIFTCGDNFKVLTDTTTDTGYSNFYVIDYSNEEEPYAMAYNGEEVIGSALCWVLEDEHKNAYFTKGHSEVIDPTFVNLLSASGYNVGTIDLKSAEVPEDTDLLVISNPRGDFEASAESSGARSETYRLAHYIAGGGNLFVTLNSLAEELPILEALLSEYGISLSYATNEEGDRAVNIVKDTAKSIVPDGYTLIADYPDNASGIWIKDNVERYSDGGVIIRDVAALELSGEAKPLLIASETAKTYSHGEMTDSQGSYPIAAYATVITDDGEQGRVVVIPSIYLTATSALVTNEYANGDFLRSVFETLYDRSPLVYGSSIISFETPILEGLTMQTAGIYTAIIMAIPVALAVVGAVVLTRRKNR